jgi:hypothetical protein
LKWYDKIVIPAFFDASWSQIERVWVRRITAIKLSQIDEGMLLILLNLKNGAWDAPDLNLMALCDG